MSYRRKRATLKVARNVFPLVSPNANPSHVTLLLILIICIPFPPFILPAPFIWPFLRNYIATSQKNFKAKMVDREKYFCTLSSFQRMTAEDFEEYIEFIFQQMGYETWKKGHVNARDQGVDIEARRDGKFVVIQCKHYTGAVGSPEIQKFIGAMVDAGADKGVFVTTSFFTEPAIRTSMGKPLELVGPKQILEWQKMLGIGTHYIERAPELTPPSTLPPVVLSQQSPNFIFSGWQWLILLVLICVACMVSCGVCTMVGAIVPPPGS